MRLSEHFTLEELTRTSTGLPNEPEAHQGEYLVILCETLLEPARALLGVPLDINSGFRTPAVNKAVGGAGTKPGQKPSAHMDGRAADVVPIGMDIDLAFDRLRHSDLPFDQLITEVKVRQDGTISRWLHMAIAPLGTAPRRQVLAAQVAANGDAVYREVR